MDLPALFSRLQDARLEVDFANAYVKEAQHDVEAGTLATEDTHDPQKAALEKQRSAVEEYMDVLQQFLQANCGESRLIDATSSRIAECDPNNADKRGLTTSGI